MIKKYPSKILTIFLILTILSLPFYPIITPALGIICLLISLAVSTYIILEKHKESENSRFKITKDILILVFTILLISFLGGVAGLFTNFYVSNLLGAVAGLICAILVGFLIGYIIRKGVMKLTS